MDSTVLRKEIRKQAIANALSHGGKASQGSVISHLLGANPDLRKETGSIMPEISKIISEVNALSIEEQQNIAASEFPEILHKEDRGPQEHHLPDLRNHNGRVVMRMAPSPSGPLHIGHSRMAILNDEYVKRYGGELILRIEDTNPANIDPFAYEQIPRDLEWLGVRVDRLIVQSDRMDIYYKEARNLIEMGKMYACTCKTDEFKAKLLKSIACPHREQDISINREAFNNAVEGRTKSKEAAFVVKTDLDHPNPSVRDWIAFRVIDTPHPRHGNKYHLYPLMNFSVAVDDHLLGLTHVIRGKDHINNTEKQKYIFRYNGWALPEYYHYGLVNFPDVILKTSIIKKGIQAGQFSGWDDIRLGTLMAFKKRGYRKETFRKYWIDSGMREIDSEFSKEIFNSINKSMIDGTTPRLFFVRNPVILKIDKLQKTGVDIRNHPTNKDLGQRHYDIQSATRIAVSLDDWAQLKDGDTIRLKDFCNIRKTPDGAEFAGKEMNKGVQIVQWVPDPEQKFTVFRPDGTSDSGFVEKFIMNGEGLFQFERYGFVNKGSNETGYYLHR
jgi:glutamyl-tRNA synthetase